AAEILYFAAFYGELMGASGKAVFPETVFDLAAALRLVMVCVLAGFVVRDILRPERDVVRQTYEGQDRGGGVFTGDGDAGALGADRAVGQSSPFSPESWSPGRTIRGPVAVRMAAGWVGTTGWSILLAPSTSTSTSGIRVASRTARLGRYGTRCAASSYERPSR